MTSTADTVASRAQTGASFGPMQQIDAGLLNVGYVDAGPAGAVPQRTTIDPRRRRDRSDGRARDRQGGRCRG